MLDTKRCTKCGVVKPRMDFSTRKTADGNASHCKKCFSTWVSTVYNKRPAAKAANLSRVRAWNDKERLNVIQRYGGKCSCCGESNFAFLTIHHVDNDGAAHRKEIGEGGQALRRFLKRNDYPQDRFTCLCYNCNCSLGFYGYCPHNLPVNDEVLDANGR